MYYNLFLFVFKKIEKFNYYMMLKIIHKQAQANYSQSSPDTSRPKQIRNKMAYVLLEPIGEVSLYLDIVQRIYAQLLLIKQKELMEHKEKFCDTSWVIKNCLPKWEDEEIALRRSRHYFTFDAEKNYKIKLRMFLKKIRNLEEQAHVFAFWSDPHHRNSFSILVPLIDV